MMSLSRKSLVRNPCTSSLDLGPPMFSMRIPVFTFCARSVEEEEKFLLETNAREKMRLDVSAEEEENHCVPGREKKTDKNTQTEKKNQLMSPFILEVIILAMFILLFVSSKFLAKSTFPRPLLENHHRYCGTRRDEEEMHSCSSRPGWIS